MILFIDDDKRLMDSYIEELRFHGFHVVFESNVDRALKFLEERLPEVELLILDLLMAPGESFVHTANEHVTTGGRFYERVRETQPDLPIIVLTNLPSANRAFEGDPHCQFFRKMDLFPYQLADVVTKTLKR